MAEKTKKNRKKRQNKGTAVLWVMGGVVLTIFVFILGVAMWEGKEQQDGLPSFKLTTLSGEKISSNDLRGKVVLVNFWASWCPPCIEEMPYLQEAWGYYALNEDVVFLGIASGDSLASVKGFQQEYQISFDLALDNGNAASAFGVTGLPTTYIIMPNGKVAYQKMGAFTSAEDIIQIIDVMMAP